MKPAQNPGGRTIRRVRAIAVAAVLVLAATCSSDGERAGPATTTTPSTSAPTTTAVRSTATTAAETTVAPSATTAPSSTAAPTTPPPTTPPVAPAALTETPCPGDYPGRARCSTLVVAADHADPSAGTISLPVTVFPATGSAPVADPIVVPAGGPGFPGANDFSWNQSRWNEQHDIVVYDQRGTGGAVPNLECPDVDALFVMTLQSAAPYLDERDAFTAAQDACLAGFTAAGIDLGDYDSEASAADLEAMRVALGYGPWNIIGISYGGRLALTAMRSHPQGIRSVILDSVYDVTYGGPAATVQAVERAFTRLAEGCAADAACASRYGDLAALIEQVRQQYNTAPAVVSVDLDGDGEGPREFVITGDDLMAGLFNRLYDDSLIPLLPQVVTSLANGETGVLSVLIQDGVRIATGFADAMEFVVDCADNAGLGAQAADAAVFEDPGRLGLVVAQGGLCPADWPAAPGPFNAPVESDIPALVLAGSYDPITPPDGTRAVAERLPNSTFVLVEPGGHAVIDFSECMRDIGLAFLTDPTATLDASCAAAIPPVTFD